MNGLPQNAPGFDQHSISNRMDIVCDAFEREWIEKRTPRLEDYLYAAGEAERLELFELLLGIELTYQQMRGETPQCEEYVERFPEMHETVVRLVRDAKLHAASSAPQGTSINAQNGSSNAGENTAADTAGPPEHSVRLKCPHCDNEITVNVGSDVGDIPCPVCGSHFQINQERTATWSSKKLPVIGKFELLEEVGRGSFGTVYRARDTDLNRIVAIKLPRSRVFSTQEDEDRFVREARNVARLNHPGIVPVYEVSRTAEFPYIVAEFVDGLTLGETLELRRFSFDETAELLVDVAMALDHAHEQGVVHRDIKPSNIMLHRNPEHGSTDTKSGSQAGSQLETLKAKGSGSTRGSKDDVRQSGFRPRLMDFGLARPEEGEVTLTVDGQLLGTPAYMSPEQARGDVRRVDRRSDVYSLGVVMYEMLTRELPFRGNIRMLIQQVLYDEPLPPRKRNNRIPRDLETICLKCLQKSPDRRYPTAAEVGTDLRRWLRREPISARPVGLLEQIVLWCKRRPTIAASLGMLAVVTLVGVVGVLLQWREAESARGTAERALTKASNALVRADAEARRAQDEGRLAKKHLYIASMNWISQAWESGNMARVSDILNSQRPETTGEDYRNFEWYYWWKQCHKDDLTIPGHDGGVTDVAISKTRLASASATGVVYVWDLDTGAELLRIEPEDKDNVHLDLEDRWLATSGYGSQVKIWDVDSGECLHTLEGHTDQITTLAFSGGRQLITASADSLVKLWDPRSGKEIRTFSGHTGPVTHVASGAGSIASVEFVESDDSSRCRIWDIGTGECKIEFMLSAKPQVSGICFLGSKTLISSTYWGQTKIHVWDIETGEKIYTWPAHFRDSVTAMLSGSPFGLITGSSDTTIRTWGSLGNPERVLQGHTGAITSIDLYGSTLVSGSADGTLRVWNPFQAEAIRWSSSGNHDLTYSPDGQQLAATGKGNSVRLFDFVEASPAKGTRNWRDLDGHEAPVYAIAYSPDQQLLATGSGDATVRIWDLTNETCEHVLDEHEARITSVEFSADGSWLMSSSLDGKVIIWDRETFEVLKVFDRYKSVLEAAISPDGRWLACVGENHASADNPDSPQREIVVWERETSEVRFRPIPTSGSDIKFSPNGKLLAVTQPRINESLVVIDSQTGRVVQTFITGSRAIAEVEFTPDSKRIAGAYYTSLVMWDVEMGLEVLSQYARSDSLIRSLAIRPDGRQIVTGNLASEIQIWDTELHSTMDSQQRARLNAEIGR